jgi:predicted ribonuclease YlaK
VRRGERTKRCQPEGRGVGVGKSNVSPLRVIDELDRQKYGQGDLAKKAATAIRYLERVLTGTLPGQPVQLRQGATLEVRVDTDDRGGDADLSILRCAADLDNLHQDTGARVLTTMSACACVPGRWA